MSPLSVSPQSRKANYTLFLFNIITKQFKYLYSFVLNVLQPDSTKHFNYVAIVKTAFDK